MMARRRQTTLKFPSRQLLHDFVDRGGITDVVEDHRKPKLYAKLSPEEVEHALKKYGAKDISQGESWGFIVFMELVGEIIGAFMGI